MPVMEAQPDQQPLDLLAPFKYLGNRLRGGQWGDLAERYAGRIAFSNEVRAAEHNFPSKVTPIGIKGVGIPPRPNRSRAV